MTNHFVRYALIGNLIISVINSIDKEPLSLLKWDAL